MTKRIFRTIFTSAILVLLLSLALFVTILHSYFDEQVFAELSGEAHYIAQGVESMGMDYFSGLKSVNRITYIGPDGQVLYDSAADSAAMENHAGRQEVRDALAAGEGRSSRRSETLA